MRRPRYVRRRAGRVAAALRRAGRTPLHALPPLSESAAAAFACEDCAPDHVCPAAARRGLAAGPATAPARHALAPVCALSLRPAVTWAPLDAPEARAPRLASIARRVAVRAALAPAPAPLPWRPSLPVTDASDVAAVAAARPPCRTGVAVLVPIPPWHGSPAAPAAPLASALDVWDDVLRELPAAATAAAVSTFTRAWERRVMRTDQPVVRKRNGGGGYVAAPRPLRPHRGPIVDGVDLRTIPQQAPTEVVRAMRLDARDAAAHGVPEYVLAHAVLGALRRSRRTPPADPQGERGTCPIPSPLVAAEVERVVRAAGLAYPTADDVVYGMDMLDCGGARYAQAPNHASVAPFAGELRALFEAQVRKGWHIDVTRTLTAAPLVPHNVIPLGAVLKASGKVRPVSDATSYDGPNVMADPSALLPSRMHGAAEYAPALWALRARLPADAHILQQPHDVADAYNAHGARVQDAFTHIFSLDGRFYAPLRGLFGQRVPGFHCCSLTTAIARATVREAAAVGIDAVALPWVDDTIIATVAHDAPALEAIHIRGTRAVGYTDAVAKLAPPAAVVEWVGLAWDARPLAQGGMRVTLTDKRREKALAAAARVAGARRMQLEELQSALGVIDSVAPAVPSLAAFSAAARACTAVPAGTPCTHYVAVTPAARAEGATWADIISASRGASLMPRDERARGAPSVYSDASTEWGFGFYIPDGGIYCSEPWPADLLAAGGVELPIINVLEEFSSFLGLVAADADPHGAISAAHRGALVWTDNQANEGAMRKLRSSSPAMSLFTRAIACWSARTDVVPLPHYVPGLLHVQADALSRGTIPSCFLAPPWRRVRFSPTHLAALLSSAAPWQMAVEPQF